MNLTPFFGHAIGYYNRLNRFIVISGLPWMFSQTVFFVILFPSAGLPRSARYVAFLSGTTQ